ncbi:MAG: hypothetical protein CMF59_19795 [Leptospiraceae bacterium]|nr:hypothetical protein [Leptospiraceae bacterium]
MPSKNLSPDTLEKAWNVTLPERLHEFFSSGDWKNYEGMAATNLYGFSSDVRAELTFKDREELPDKFEYSEDFQARKGLWPLCDILNLGGTFFMAVDLKSRKLPVYFFDYESGFQKHSDALDSFLASLLKPDEKTPAEKHQDLHTSARALYDAEDYESCAQTIEAGLNELGEVNFDVFDQFKSIPGALRNLLALCYKNTGNFDRAIEIFEAAVAEGEKSAALNLMSIFLDQKEYQKLVDYANEVSASMFMLWDDYSAYYSFLYRAIAYAQLNNRKDATKYFGFIATRFQDNAERLEQTVQRIKEEKEKGNPGGIFDSVLSWMDRTPEPLAAQEKKDLLGWWKSLSIKELKSQLAELMDKKPSRVNAQDIQKLLRRTELKLDHSDLEYLDDLRLFRRLRSLSLEGCNLSSLEGLNWPALKKLSLKGNPLKEISQLSSLSRLEDLDIAKTEVTDLNPLSSLKNLRELRANDNQIESLEPLTELPELKEINIYDNQIRDLNVLKNNTLLKEISCFSNPLEAVGLKSALELRNLPLLQELEPHWDKEPKGKDLELWLSARPWEKPMNEEELQDWTTWWKALPDAWKEALESEVDDIEDGVPTEEGFFDLRKENHLSLSDNDLETLEPLTRLVRADWVSVRKNGIKELPDLSSLGALRTLNLEENQIQDLSPLQNIPLLAKVDLSKNGLKGELSLPEIPTLRTLDLSHNELTGIQCLSALKGLRRLELIENSIEDLSPLKNLTELRELFIQQNEIRNIEALSGCSSLEELVIFGNPSITGLLALKDLPYLCRIRAHGALMNDEITEFRKLRPDVDIL